MAPNTQSMDRLTESKAHDDKSIFRGGDEEYSKSEQGDSKPAAPVPLLRSYRLMIVMMGCTVLCSSFANQTSMTSALVCMIDDNSSSIRSSSSSSVNSINHYHHHRCSGNARGHSNRSNINTTIGLFDAKSFNSSKSPLDLNKTIEEEDETWKFTWDSETQGWVVSSFFVGYYVMQLPSGVIVTRLGPKSSLVFGLLATGILHILSIPVARWNLAVLFAVRGLAGLACGCMLPGTFALVANWCPQQETSMLFAITSNGIDVGSSFSFILSMFGCETDFQGGWPIVFYILGFFNVVIGLFLLLFVTDFPSSHPCISSKEQKYIYENRSHNNKASVIPLSKILRSRPVWAFVVAQFATDWVIVMVVTQGPLYLRDILLLPHWKTNMLSSFPFLTSIPFGVVIGYVSKRVVETRTASTTTVRKLTETFAKILCSVPLVVLMMLPEGSWVSVFVLYACVAMGIASTYSGFMANPGDLSPAHAGFVASLGQALSMWSAFVIPVFTAYITKEKTRESWQVIFNITIAIEVFSMFIYLLFGSGALQPWALEPCTTIVENPGERTPIVSKSGFEKGALSRNAILEKSQRE